jgi:CubicO group peptidase (beta-lactamase class C family)
LKNLFYTLGLLALIYGCNQSASTNNAKPEPPEDSLQYYAPTPKSINKAEFRRYVRTLNDFFNEELINGAFNGGILVAKDGNILYEKYVGYEDLATRDPMTDSTPLHIASASKPFTAIAVLRLVQDNKLSLDDTLQKFFPTLPYEGITVKMLLNHRSGLPNYVNFMDDKKLWDRTKICTNEDMLKVLSTGKAGSSGRPGKRFNYCNTNFVLLAMIVEQLTGVPFPQYMKQTYFDPLQMTHTHIYTLTDTGKVVLSYKQSRAVWENDQTEGTYGDKNVYSTPKDLLKFDQALYTEQLVRKSLLDTAFTPYSNERPSVHNYGLGFRLLMFPNDKKVVYHTGRWHGFNAIFARLTDEKATIIILGNKYNLNIYRAAKKSYSLFGNYGRDEDDNEDEHEANKEETVKKAPAKAPVKRPVKRKVTTKTSKRTPAKRVPSKY